MVDTARNQILATTHVAPMPELPVDYARWNRALVEHTFPPGRHGARVYLNIYDSLLDEISEEYRFDTPGREGFVRSVLSLDPDRPLRLFEVLEGLRSVWADAGFHEYPPFVAGISLAVIAASEMRSEPTGIRSTNYYLRLNTLLGSPDRQELPPGFDRTPGMWKELAEWLRTNRRGELALSGLGGRRPYVAPAESQCLIRAGDLAELGPLLKESGYVADSTIDPDEILPFVSRWLRGPGSTSRLARILGTQPDRDSLLLAGESLADTVEMAEDEGYAVSIDGGILRPESPGLLIEPYPHPRLRWKRASWLLACPAGNSDASGPVPIELGGTCQGAKFDGRDPPRFVANLPLLSAAAAADLPGTAILDNRKIHFSLATPGWFQDGALRGRPGAWEQVQSLAPDTEYTVVFSRPEFDRFAEAYGGCVRQADGDQDFILGDERNWPGPGLCACRVVLIPDAELPSGLTIRSSLGPLKLISGMQVRRSVYLRGGLGELAVEEGPDIEVRQLPSDSVITSVPAHELPEVDLEEGTYELRRGERRTTISITDPRWGELRIPRRRPASDGTEHLASGTFRGAYLEDQQALYALHLLPGKRYRVYRPNVEKIDTKTGAGIQEVSVPTSDPHLIVVGRTGPPASAIPASPYLIDSASAARGISSEEAVKASRFLDHLVLFIGARASATVDSLRPHCARVAREGEPWHSVLSRLEALGYLDIHWIHRRWAAAPPVICRRSATSGQCFLAGIRTADLAPKISCFHGVSISQDPGRFLPNRPPAPACIVVRGENPSALSLFAKELGFRFPEEPPSHSLAVRHLPITATGWWLGRHVALPQRALDVAEHWDPELMTWREGPGESRRGENEGLFRWREGGAWQNFAVISGSRRKVNDPAAAKWHFAPATTSYLRFAPERAELILPVAMGLPRLLGRACVLASGLPPARHARRLTYGSISIYLARMIAVRLGQARAEGLWK